MERGLRASIWAPRSYENANSSRRLAAWTCSSCGFSNFLQRTECFRCRQAIKANGDGILDPVLAPQKIDDGDVAEGQDKEESSQADKNLRITGQLTEDFLNGFRGKGGLSTSRWAPRNDKGRHKKADDREVWTRTVIVDNATSTRAENKSLATSSHPDLGLPYEVQHYILSMIQRMLEEGCYDFASRQIPDTLRQNNWTCSEAVELSTWKKFLPTALPQSAIVPVLNYSLEDALADAVRIRNAAVHRHLCDNIEIRRMASQAQDLMLMFSDVMRQNRLKRLEVELHCWDAESQDDEETKRNNLQAALQEISERPLDDMDWTPNAVSLYELRPDTQEYLETQDYFADEMDLD